MANTSRIAGFRPVKHLNGSPYNGQASIYEVPSGEAVAVAVGDMMILSNSAATDYYPAAEIVAGSGEVTAAQLLGPVVGIVLSTAVGSSLDVPIVRPASTKRFVLIADSPDLIFEVEDGATVPTPIASIGLNTGIQATASSTVTGRSQHTTGNTAATTTNTLPLQIVGIVNSPANEPAAAYQKLLVRINTHALVGNSTGQTGV